MDPVRIIDRLERFPAALDASLALVRDEEWDARSDPAAWSLFDVLRHLVIEETQDFRPRIACTLAEPEGPWPPLDPSAAVEAARSEPGTPAEWLARFRRERVATLAWLRSLPMDDATWGMAHTHPRIGPIHAADLLAAWAAHDARHLAQIAKLVYDRTVADGEPYTVLYAG